MPNSAASPYGVPSYCPEKEPRTRGSFQASALSGLGSVLAPHVREAGELALLQWLCASVPSVQEGSERPAVVSLPGLHGILCPSHSYRPSFVVPEFRCVRVEDHVCLDPVLTMLGCSLELM